MLRKRKEEKMGMASKGLVKSDVEQDAVKSFASADKDEDTSVSHLMTLSGEVSVFDIPNKQQSVVRLQSQSDFATVVTLLDTDKLASCIQDDNKSGIYIEYTIQSGGLAQIGWIRSPDPNDDDSPRFLPNSDTGDGVGDDSASFGYDGSRGMKFHNGKEESYGNCEQLWKTGDVLGCWCKLAAGEQIEIGYTLNGKELGVAFSLSATSDDLSRYFPAVSLNLGEVVDIKFRSNAVKEGCIDVSSLIMSEDDRSSSNNDIAAKEVDEDSGSPPKKKAREDADQKQCSTEQESKPASKTEDADDQTPFDLDSCKSVDELLEMDPTKLKNILLSMGVKCG